MAYCFEIFLKGPMHSRVRLAILTIFHHTPTYLTRPVHRESGSARLQTNQILQCMEPNKPSVRVAPKLPESDPAAQYPGELIPEANGAEHHSTQCRTRLVRPHTLGPFMELLFSGETPFLHC